MSYTPVEVSPDPNNNNNGGVTKSEEKPYTHNHHHHHGKHKDSYYHRWKDGTWGAWICIGFFCIFFLTTIILLIVYGVQWNETNHHMDALEAKMKTENARLTHNGIYTVSNSAAHHKIEYDVSLCHVEAYRLSVDEQDPTLKLVNDTDTLESDEEDTFSVQAVLSMRYNVEAEKLLIDGFKGRARGKYLVLNYEFLTNYAEFSTIRLVEYSLDIYEKRISATKDIYLCSNNPSRRRDTPRCSRLTTGDGLMFLNNTDFYPMESSTKLVVRGSSTSVPTTSRDASEDGEEEGEGEEEEEVVLEDDVTDLRFYKLYCYRETDDKDDDFLEYLALTLKPTRCATA